MWLHTKYIRFTLSNVIAGTWLTFPSLSVCSCSSSCSFFPSCQHVNQRWLCCSTLSCTWDVSRTWTASETPVCVSMKSKGNCDTTTGNQFVDCTNSKAQHWQTDASNKLFFQTCRFSQERSSFGKVNVKIPSLKSTQLISFLCS